MTILAGFPKAVSGWERAWTQCSPRMAAPGTRPGDSRQRVRSETAPAAAPVDWFRGLRDITALLRAWTAETGCGSTHQAPASPLRPFDAEGWKRFVSGDVARPGRRRGPGRRRIARTSGALGCERVATPNRDPAVTATEVSMSSPTRHDIEWSAAGLRRAAAEAGVALPVDYARTLAADGLK